jgi:hypothetical protein
MSDRHSVADRNPKKINASGAAKQKRQFEVESQIEKLPKVARFLPVSIHKMNRIRATALLFRRGAMYVVAACIIFQSTRN